MLKPVRASVPGRTAAAALLRALVPLLACCAVGACSWLPGYFPGFLKPYRPDVQQGNVITSEMVEQLRPGMTRDQVRFMLGTPLLADTFHKDRWDYLYYLNPRSGSTQHRKLTIVFADNRLKSFQSDPMPPESMADNLILGRKGKVAAKPKPAPAEPAADAAATPAVDTARPPAAAGSEAPAAPEAPGPEPETTSAPEPVPAAPPPQ
jgi:outer membrane protein assembly factor BamE